LPDENVVSVEGNVYNPGLVAFTRGITMRDAIIQAGGYKPNSMKNRAYVKKANGQVSKASIFLGRSKRLNPGDMIFVPVDPDPNKFDITTFIADFSTTLANIAAILLIVENQND
jgi:protein involved in polysaccharide export with SLBB domain